MKKNYFLPCGCRVTTFPSKYDGKLNAMRSGGCDMLKFCVYGGEETKKRESDHWDIIGKNRIIKNLSGGLK